MPKVVKTLTDGWPRSAITHQAHRCQSMDLKLLPSFDQELNNLVLGRYPTITLSMARPLRSNEHARLKAHRAK